MKWEIERKTIMKKFNGELLRSLRTRKGWTIEELAYVLGVSDTSLKRWEEGKAKPKTERVIEIAEFFGVNIKSLWR